MKYGLREDTLRLPLEDTFYKAAELSFDGIELIVPKERKDYLASKLWDSTGVEEIKKLVTSSGLEVSSICLAPFHRLHYLIEPNPKEQGEGQRLFEHTTKLCAQLGAGVILVPLFQLAPEHVGSRALLDGLKRSAEPAEENQVQLALETKLRAEDLLEIIRKVGSDYLKVYFDTGNVVMYGYDPYDQIVHLGDRIAQIHIKDTDNNLLGEGRVDFDYISRAIHKIGYEGYLVLETPPGDRPVETAAYNLAFLRKHI